MVRLSLVGTVAGMSSAPMASDFSTFLVLEFSATIFASCSRSVVALSRLSTCRSDRVPFSMFYVLLVSITVLSFNFGSPYRRPATGERAVVGRVIGTGLFLVFPPWFLSRRFIFVDRC